MHAKLPGLLSGSYMWMKVHCFIFTCNDSNGHQHPHHEELSVCAPDLICAVQAQPCAPSSMPSTHTAEARISHFVSQSVFHRDGSRPPQVQQPVYKRIEKGCGGLKRQQSACKSGQT